jgi:hypothetical protein
MKIPALVDARELSEFVKHRLNSDGGYTFARKLYGFEFPSSSSETYYALATLAAIGEEIPLKDKTVEYLKGIQDEDGLYSSLKVAFHVVKALRLLGERPSKSAYVLQCQAAARNGHEHFEKFNSKWFPAGYDSEDSSFSSIFYAAKVLKMADARMERRDFAWIANGAWQGGGFGVGSPNVASTYHALSALSCAGIGPEAFLGSAEFIETCRVRGGGYTPVARGSPAFLETTYFAIAALGLLGARPAGMADHARFLSDLQNGNGGFRRSSAGGISLLSNCYFAAKTLSMLSGDANGKTQF